MVFKSRLSYRCTGCFHHIFKTVLKTTDLKLVLILFLSRSKMISPKTRNVKQREIFIFSPLERVKNWYWDGLIKNPWTRTAQIQMSTCLVSFKQTYFFLRQLKRWEKMGQLFWYLFVSVLSQFSFPWIDQMVDGQMNRGNWFCVITVINFYNIDLGCMAVFIKHGYSYIIIGLMFWCSFMEVWPCEGRRLNLAFSLITWFLNKLPETCTLLTESGWPPSYFVWQLQ
jgi:hypothetical protein